MLVDGFPNMVMLGGPQIAAANFPLGSEVADDWVTPMLHHLWNKGYTRSSVKNDAQQGWFESAQVEVSLRTPTLYKCPYRRQLGRSATVV